MMTLFGELAFQQVEALLLRSDEFFKHLEVLLLRFNGFDRLPESLT
ncbi:hypothetical protein [Ktedonobacter robiniae]|uniref:Uncharacterized protein n=1 Tax=Ktedonobacter robiniae TaxID=2778365 RepID=A0ABQ3UUA5_9CHLR|nr:hypothetical protein [Ktedonobacter robiniae]GHO56257.1 hypothetical protein KSB_47320 [Ktedonobacter robiniae]